MEDFKEVTQIELFWWDRKITLGEFQNMINQWLKDHNDFDILDIKLFTNAASRGNWEDFSEIENLYVVVVYRM